MGVVTLTTDFGTADYAAGLLNGVIWSIAPGAEIVVLSHDIPRHNVFAGAMLLDRSLPYFPDDTVHVCVVDPGVGTQRRPIAARLGSQFFVGPDNGLITLAAKRCIQNHETVEIYHLNKPNYWHAEVSNIFHGRDIFCPIGAHLAHGVSLEQVGIPVTDPIWIDFPSPVHQAEMITGQVMHVDYFGNLSTNIKADDLPENAFIHVSVKDQIIPGISATFGAGRPGDMVAIIDSSSYLSVCVVNGSAANMLGLTIGDVVIVSWNDPILENGANR